MRMRASWAEPRMSRRFRQYGGRPSGPAVDLMAYFASTADRIHMRRAGQRRLAAISMRQGHRSGYGVCVVLLKIAITTPAMVRTATTEAMIQASRRRCRVAALTPIPMLIRIAIEYNEMPRVRASGEMSRPAAAGAGLIIWSVHHSLDTISSAPSVAIPAARSMSTCSHYTADRPFVGPFPVSRCGGPSSESEVVALGK